MKKRNTVLQQFVTYAVKDFIEKIKILEKSEIIVAIQGNLEVLHIYHVICNIKNIVIPLSAKITKWSHTLK